MKFPTQEAKFFKFNPLFVVLTISNNISVAQARVDEKKN